MTGRLNRQAPLFDPPPPERCPDCGATTMASTLRSAFPQGRCDWCGRRLR